MHVPSFDCSCNELLQGQLEPGCTVLLHNKVLSVVGLLSDETDPMVSVMKARRGFCLCGPL